MYHIIKQMTIKSNNFLDLDYYSKDSANREYNYDIKVYCKSSRLNNNGMIVDFDTIDKLIKNLNNQNINQLIPFNPTAENLAKYLCHTIPHCYQVEIAFDEKALAIYRRNRVK